MRTAFCIALPWLAFSGCGAPADPQGADRDAIRELVVRHYLKDRSSSRMDQCSSRRVVFVVFDRKTDPADAFLARLGDLQGRFCKGSRAVAVEHEFPFDPLTREPAILIVVRDLRLIDERKAEVDGGFYKGRLCAYGGTFLIEKVDGKWKVSRETDHWES